MDANGDDDGEADNDTDDAADDTDDTRFAGLSQSTRENPCAFILRT